MSDEEKRRRQKVSRGKALLSFVLILISALLFVYGYYRGWPFSPQSLLLRDAIARSGVLLTVLVVAIVLLVALIRTLRCPVCGAFVARQVPLWRFPQFKCAKCGYSADEH